MPADTRTLHWYQSRDDNAAINNNGWKFQIAKLVATSPTAPPTFNIVWQSKATAPVTTISWKVQYALNWTADPPSEGVTLGIGSTWQPCNPGESYDIDPSGYWSPSAKSGDPNWLNVGDVNYSYPGIQGIHIVVGVWNVKTATYDPIYVDKTVLPRGSSATYQPQETVSWWFQGGDRTGQVFSGTRSPSTSFNFNVPSNPATETYEYSTSYLMTGPKQAWTISKGAPPSAFSAPPPSAQIAALTLGGSPPVLIELDPGRWTVFFTKALEDGPLKTIAGALRDKIKWQLDSGEVTFKQAKTGSTITVTYKAGSDPAAILSLGTAAGGEKNPKDIINDSLTDLRTSGVIPADESWTFGDLNDLAADGPPQGDVPSETVAQSATPAARAALDAPAALYNGQNGFIGGQPFQQGIVGKGLFAQNYPTGVVA